MAVDTIESLRAELEVVKASKRKERSSLKELIDDFDILKLKYEALLRERDLLVLSWATWRARAVALGWGEGDEKKELKCL